MAPVSSQHRTQEDADDLEGLVGWLVAVLLFVGFSALGFALIRPDVPARPDVPLPTTAAVPGAVPDDRSGSSATATAAGPDDTPRAAEPDAEPVLQLDMSDGRITVTSSAVVASVGQEIGDLLTMTTGQRVEHLRAAVGPATGPILLTGSWPQGYRRGLQAARELLEQRTVGPIHDRSRSIGPTPLARALQAELDALAAEITLVFDPDTAQLVPEGTPGLISALVALSDATDVVVLLSVSADNDEGDGDDVRALQQARHVVDYLEHRGVRQGLVRAVIGSGSGTAGSNRADFTVVNQ